MRLRNNVNAPARYGEVDDRRRGPTQPLYPDLLAAQTVPYNPDLPPAAFPSLPLVGNVDTGRHDPTLSTQCTGAADLEDNESMDEEIPDELDEMEVSDKDSTSELHDNAKPSFDFASTDRTQRDISLSDSDAEETLASWSSLVLAVQFHIFNTLLKTAKDTDVVAATLNLTPSELTDLEYKINLRKIHPATYDEIYQYAIAASGSEFGFIDPDKMGDYLEYLTFASHYEIAGESEVEDGRKFLLQLGLDATMMNQFKEDDQGMKLSQLPVANLDTAGVPANANADSAAYTTSTIMEDKGNEEDAYNHESGVDDIIGLEPTRAGFMHAAEITEDAEHSRAGMMDRGPNNSPFPCSVPSTGTDFDDTTKTKQTVNSSGLCISISETVRKRGRRQPIPVRPTDISQPLGTATDRAKHILPLRVTDLAINESRVADPHRKKEKKSPLLRERGIHEHDNPNTSATDSHGDTFLQSLISKPLHQDHDLNAPSQQPSIIEESRLIPSLTVTEHTARFHHGSNLPISVVWQEGTSGGDIFQLGLNGSASSQSNVAAPEKGTSNTFSEEGCSKAVDSGVSMTTGAKTVKCTTFAIACLAGDVNQSTHNGWGKEEESEAIVVPSTTHGIPPHQQIRQSAQHMRQVVARSQLQTILISPEIRDNQTVRHEYIRLNDHNKPFLSRLLSAAAETAVLPHRQSQMRVDINARETGPMQNNIRFASSVAAVPTAVNDHSHNGQSSHSLIPVLQGFKSDNTQHTQPLLSSPCEAIVRGSRGELKMNEPTRKHATISQKEDNEELHNMAAVTLNEISRRDRTEYTPRPETQQSTLAISNPAAITSSESSMEIPTATDSPNPQGYNLDTSRSSTQSNATDHNQGISPLPPGERYSITDPRWMPPSYKIGSSSSALSTARAVPARSPFTPVAIMPATARPHPEPRNATAGPSTQNDAGPASAPTPSTGKRRRSDFGKKRGPYKKRKTGK